MSDTGTPAVLFFFFLVDAGNRRGWPPFGGVAKEPDLRALRALHCSGHAPGHGLSWAPGSLTGSNREAHNNPQFTAAGRSMMIDPLLQCANKK